MTDLYMVFDVESIGLHGEGFAVGYVVVGADGAIHEADRFSCPPDRAAGEDEGRAWVAANVPSDGFYGCGSPVMVRNGFWRTWLAWKERGAVLVADCAWPVEARFLIACVDDATDDRQWQGPFPLHELASFMVAAGMESTATVDYERLPDEPQHDPLGDARQSARLLVTALARLRGEPQIEAV